MPDMRERLQPFEITYRLVTGRITDAAKKLPDPQESHWLLVLIDGFWHQYAHWGDPQYEPYWRAFARIRPRLLRLAACAYLHISYDLPRVIADQWPGVNPWVPAPTETQGELIYFRLNPIFPEVFSTIARDRRVVGGWAPLIRLAPRRALGAAAQWAMHLRTASWPHAARLRAAGGGRKFREQKMLEAMAAALEDVSSMPWSAAVLLPPHEAVLKTVPLAPLPVIQTVQDHPLATSAVLAGAAVALGSWWFWRSARREREITGFINELGARVLEYTTAAAGDPDGFDRYRRARMGGAG